MPTPIAELAEIDTATKRVNKLCDELSIPVQFFAGDGIFQTFHKLMQVEEQILLHERERRQRP